MPGFAKSKPPAGNQAKMKQYMKASQAKVPTVKLPDGSSFKMDKAGVNARLGVGKKSTQGKAGGKSIDLNKDLHQFDGQGKAELEKYKKMEAKTTEPTWKAPSGSSVNASFEEGVVLKPDTGNSPESHLRFLQKAFGPGGPGWMK